MRLLLDEMISPTVAQQLRARGHDVVAVAERADLVQSADEQVLHQAAQEDRVLVTLDVADFAVLAGQWAAQGRGHAGIIYVSGTAFAQDRSLLGALITALDAASHSQLLPGPGATEFLTRPPWPHRRRPDKVGSCPAPLPSPPRPPSSSRRRCAPAAAPSSAWPTSPTPSCGWPRTTPTAWPAPWRRPRPRAGCSCPSPGSRPSPRRSARTGSGPAPRAPTASRSPSTPWRWRSRGCAACPSGPA
ncbi:MAG: DUF5615 family PIN-like protein, partial [Frankiales bacterium]|nr:DUF5615 family PIN-like protein [Frankiales bacterium]